MFGSRGEELSKVVIAVILKVATDRLTIGVSFAVLGEIHRCRI